MEEQRIMDIFKESGVLMEGHFLLTSGKHSDKYMQCAKVFQYPEYTRELSEELALTFDGDNIEMVIGPAIGGIILSYQVSACLGVKNIFAEREDGTMTLRRGFEIPEGTQVLVVEDVITTGGSVKEVIELVKQLGGQVVGVGALVDRSGGNADFGVKFRSLLAMEIQTYEAEACPLCLDNVPLIKPGSRKLV